MKSKKAIGMTLLSAFLISGCANAFGETTSTKDSAKSDYVSSPTTSDVSGSETEISSSTTIDTEPAESEYYQYYPLPDGTLAIAVGTNTSLDSLTIPRMHHGKMVTQIAEKGFANCIALKQINLPDTIKMIGKEAFSGCSSLTSIVIPEGVTSIGNEAFSGCKSLTSVVIPEGVTSIGDKAFYCCKSLTSVVIPERVTSIGKDAFGGCLSLTSIVIPEGVTSIGGWAFSSCTSLTSVTIPDSVTSIGERAFLGCSSLTSVVIPEGVTSIDNSTFWCCTSLTSVKIGNGVASISNDAFFGCSSLTIVSIGNGVTSIGDYAFSGCTSLTSVTIPDSVTSIGYHAFEGCSSLTSVNIPDSVTSIGSGAFSGCGSLRIYFAAESVPAGWPSDWKPDFTSFVRGCVEYGSSDSFLYGISKINNKAYAVITGYRGLDTDIRIPETINGIKVAVISDSAFYGCKSLTSVTIPDSVTSIGDKAFEDCTSLTSINIPNSVTSIGDDAFLWCSSLRIYCAAKSEPAGWNYNWGRGCLIVVWDCVEYGSSDSFLYCIPNNNAYAVITGYTGSDTDIRIPETINGIKVAAISKYAFYGCTSLTSVTIPDSVTSIGGGAFWGCTSLTSIVIPEGVTSIGDRAFCNCYSLRIYCAAEKQPGGWNNNWNPDYKPVAWGCVEYGASDSFVYGISKTNNNAYAVITGYTGSDTDIRIPETINGIQVTAISDYAFWQCSSLTTVVIPEGVTSMGKHAFTGCMSLTIYCEAESKPAGWVYIWNGSDRPVVWGYKSKP